LHNERREVLKKIPDALAAEKTPDFGFIEEFKVEVKQNSPVTV